MGLRAAGCLLGTPADLVSVRALSFRGTAMKRLVLCFDGTWNAVNDPDTVTNVVKFAQAIKPTASDGTKQIVYYNSGVGSGGMLDRIFGGVFGFGLQSNVKRALAFLSL